VSSLRPRFNTVSIMPGIETGAPERTDSRSGFSDPSLLLAVFSRVSRFSLISSARPFGNVLFV